MLRLVTSRRLPRRTPWLHALLVVAPMTALLGWILVAERGPDGTGPLVSASTGAAPRADRPRPLPPGLAAARFAREQAPQQAVSAIIRAPDRSAGERCLALRRLEREAPAEALTAAERLAHEATDRQLAVNALGTLARLGGRDALSRCAATAPTEELRRVARALLDRT